MKRSSRRNFARLLALESLESRRLLTTAMPDSFSLLEDSPTALLDVMANDIVTRNVATILMSIVRKLRQRRDSQWRKNYGYSRSQCVRRGVVHVYDSRPIRNRIHWHCCHHH
jgi:hypothetical protein